MNSLITRWSLRQQYRVSALWLSNYAKLQEAQARALNLLQLCWEQPTTVESLRTMAKIGELLITLRKLETQLYREQPAWLRLR